MNTNIQFVFENNIGYFDLKKRFIYRGESHNLDDASPALRAAIIEAVFQHRMAIHRFITQNARKYESRQSL